MCRVMHGPLTKLSWSTCKHAHFKIVHKIFKYTETSSEIMSSNRGCGGGEIKRNLDLLHPPTHPLLTLKSVHEQYFSLINLFLLNNFKKC